MKHSTDMRSKTGSSYTIRVRGKRATEKANSGPVELRTDKVLSSEEEIL